LSYSSIPADFDNALVEVVDPAVLPAGWMEYPAPSALEEIGDQWAAEQRSAILQVPSVVVPAELNFILNPQHPLFAQVAVGPPTPFRFDPRLK
jgi:RES domain-containing protein